MPAHVRILSTPEGFEIEAGRPTRDVDGEALAVPPTLLLFVNDPACSGLPAAVADSGPLRWPVRPDGSVSIQVAAAVGSRAGTPTESYVVTWQQPPGAPDAPLVFLNPDGGVQVAWLPAEDPIEHVIILRDGAPIGRAPAAEARFIDPAPPGKHRYALAAETADARSASSPEAEVVVP